MSPAKPLLLSAAFFLSACISLPEVEGPQDPPDEVPDAGIPPSLTVTLAAPSGMTYTNSTVSVQLQLQGDTPESVELLVDDQPLTTLQAPYAFTWDTASVTEGLHRLSARARIADKTFSSETREVLVDRTPPQVVSRTPSPGAQDVWVRQPIQATFSEPLKASTLTNSSVKLLAEGAEVASTSSLSTDGKTLTVAPATRLAVPSSIQLTLTVAVADLAGNSLIIPGDSWSWALPTSFPLGGLSAVPGTTSADQPFLQVSSLGEPFVVWREEVEPEKFNVYASRRIGSDWEPLGSALNSVPYTGTLGLTASLFHMLRLDSSNNPIVAWVQPDGTDPGIHVKSWTDNQWVVIGDTLNAFPGTSQPPASLSLEVDTSARPVVAWEQQNDATSNIFINVWRWTGQNWAEFGAPLPMARLGAGSARPILALDRTNKPVVAWADYAPADRRFDGVNVHRWTGSSWEALGTAVDANPAASTIPGYPRLILDASDNPIIAWHETDGTASNIYVRHWTGSSWEPLGAALSAVPGDTDAGAPDLAMDDSGNLFIHWTEASADNLSSVTHVRRWTGTTWEEIGPPLSQGNFFPSLDTDRIGNPFFAWASGDTSSSVAAVHVYRYNY